MALRFRVSDEVAAVLRAALKQAADDLREEIHAALGEGDVDASDDSLAGAEPATVPWATLHRCWRLVKGFKGTRDVPATIEEVVRSTSVYHRDPSVDWRLANPDRKAAYKLNQMIRKAGQDQEYRAMVQNVDVVRREGEKQAITMKEGLLMPMDFLVLLLVNVPAVYWIAKMSSHEAYGWVFAAIAAAVIVMVEGTLITIRLAKVDGWIKPNYDLGQAAPPPKNARLKLARLPDPDPVPAIAEKPQAVHPTARKRKGKGKGAAQE
eukprot:TRINITY_DN1089_c0_g3_i1.p5 TRINITY_DN1089_c0_g3~~TRINITY_DN1089_c0_g3_i1.p5  ORF type:complete len:282 (+),score=118.49 TRINITY_DN1089_c0_g3_i1:54-848(+)